MVNPCPVCGYGLRRAPTDFLICPSCGTEFGYDDAGRTHAELRAIWLRGGAGWWSTATPPPKNWDPYLQLDNIVSPSPAWEKVLFTSSGPGQQNLSANLEKLIYGGDQQTSDSRAGLSGNPFPASQQKAKAA
jgi:hypothetical protein